ncbi:hypothetical protein ACRPHS_03625 [Pantoea allii]|uniref:hypothetical protein n=1 Tax=Pantoea allii TaxID=574096 RepID=UPI001560CD88|nr:hypothetical protein [Pantoea allii]NQS87084.1 hypothetical protein [Pantoea allii]
MRSDDFKKLDKIASSYFIKADTLFRTINFTNIALSLSQPETNPELFKAREALKEIVKNNSPIISEHGIHYDLVMKHIPSLCFSSLVSAFEDFIVEVADLILRKEPERLYNVKCEYGLFTTMNDEETINYLISEKTATLTFGSAREYTNKLCKLIDIDKRTIEHLIKPYIEIKARRDVGVHNNWVKDAKYRKKISELNIPDVSESFLKPDLDYFRHTYDTCGAMVKIIANNITSNLLNEGEMFK